MELRAAGTRLSRPKMRAWPRGRMGAGQQHFYECRLAGAVGAEQAEVVPRSTRKEIPSTARTSLPVQRLRYVFARSMVSMAASTVCLLKLTLIAGALFHIVAPSPCHTVPASRCRPPLTLWPRHRVRWIGAPITGLPTDEPSRIPPPRDVGFCYARRNLRRCVSGCF